MAHSDRTILVAGGTGALGRAVALAFLERGNTVVVTGRDRARYEQLARDAGNDRERLSGLFDDVTDPLAAARHVERVVEQHGRVDALVDAVGGWAGGAHLAATEPELFHRMIETNLVSAFALTRAVLPHLLRQGRGWIVGVASRAALAPAAGAAAYAAAKAGALALWTAVAEEVRGRRVNVNVIVPSVFDTPANRAGMPKADFDRWPKPDEIAHVVLFLCSEEARVVHGAAIPVYGAS